MTTSVPSTFTLTPPTSNKTVQDAEKKLSKAKTQLLINHPFYATLALNSRWYMDNGPDNPTMSTDGTNIYWNSEWVNAHTLDEVIFACCHEILHIVFHHCFRRNHREPEKWNMATDYIANDMLVADGIGALPKGCLHNPPLVKAGNGLAENIYDLIPDIPPNKSNGGRGGAFDGLRSPPGTQAQQAAAQANAQILTAQAVSMAKAAGELSENLKRLANEFLKSRVNWKDATRNFVSMRTKDEVTWARPKRRFIGDDLYLPSLAGEKLGAIAIAVDCSGSIDDELLNKFAGHMQAIQADLRPSSIDVYYFDSAVCHHDRFEQEDMLKVEPHGGGGTRFSPIFRAINKDQIDPVCCIVLTDGECSDYGLAPEYPVLWVMTEKTYPVPPWGQCIAMDPHQ